MLASTSVSDTSLADIRPDQKLSEEKEVLRRENVNLLQRQKELELKVQQLKCELQVCGNAKRMLLSLLRMFLTMLLSYGFIVLQFSCALLFGIQQDLSGCMKTSLALMQGDAVNVC